MFGFKEELSPFAYLGVDGDAIFAQRAMAGFPGL
jgi:hypothetical protein